MKKFLKNLKIVWQYAKDYKVMLIKYVLCNVFAIAASIILPVLSAKIIIYLTSNSFYQLLSMALVIFLIENVRNVINFCCKKYSQVIYREGFTKIQTALGREMLKLENKCIDDNSSGVFIQRLTNDTSRLADVFNVLNMYLSTIIIDLGIFIAVFIINKVVFIFLAFSISILYIVEKIRVTKYNEEDKKYRKEHEKVSGFVGEIVRGSRDIKMLNSETSFIDELHNNVVNLNNRRYLMQDIKRKYQFLNGFFTDSINFLLIVLLVFLIKDKHLAVASALVIYNYFGRLPSCVYYIGELLEKIKDFNLSASRVFSIIDSKGFTKEKFGKKHIKKINGDFEFKNVTFSYDKTQIIKNLNFKVKANETVAFVGKSGAGKTTIFNLLCKMYNITSGEITIDGYNIKDLDKETIRGNITIINQNPYIFNLSIRDNLRLVKNNLTKQEMIKACKMACLHDFISSLPDGYDTIIGEGGVNLSGGQKQRLAIARALVQKTEIILFDEATSALDNETQSQIQEAIENMKNEYTILIIAHRLSTIINSDRILFLNDGKIECEGTHQQLLRNSKEYKNLYESEITKS